MNYKELQEKVYNFKTKYKEGFIKEDTETLLKDYPDIDMDKFKEALMCHTGIMIEGNFITYHCDIYKALVCGIEKRGLKSYEWD